MDPVTVARPRRTHTGFHAPTLVAGSLIGVAVACTPDCTPGLQGPERQASRPGFATKRSACACMITPTPSRQIRGEATAHASSRQCLEVERRAKRVLDEMTVVVQGKRGGVMAHPKLQ